MIGLPSFRLPASVRGPVALSIAAIILATAPVQAAQLQQADADGRARFLDIQTITSDGGIAAWLVEDHTLPVIAMQFIFKDVGAAYDPVDKQGLAQLASNTLDEGAGPYDSEAFQKALTDHSIALRFLSGRDDFGGTLQMLTKHQDLAFDLLHVALTQPRFDLDPVERMKAANITRIRSSLSSPDWIAARITNDIGYAGHPYARNAGGTISSLQGITPDDLKDFAKNRLGRDRLVIAVTGDITPKALKARLDQIFGELPRRASVSTLSDIDIQGAGSVALYKKEIPQTMISVVAPGIDRKDPDYHAALVMNFIFGGSGFGSRLMEEIREKRGMTYGIYSGLSDMRHADTFSINASVRNENAAEVLKLVKDLAIAMRDKPVTQEELDAAKAYLIGSMPLTLTSTDDIAGLMSNLQSDGLPPSYLDKRAGLIDAVTIADVQRVARRLLHPDDMTTILVGNPTNANPTRAIDAIPNID